MTTKLFTSALFAGLVAGLMAVLLQFFLVEPLILEGEEYESGVKVHFAGVAETGEAGATQVGHDHATHDHSEAAAEVTEAAEDEAENLTVRFGLAFFADLVVFVGWGLLMVAGFAAVEYFGRKVTTKDGLLWGVAGFVAVHLAPGVGLPPELPGIPAADLQSRQLWWLSTVVSSAGALAFLAYGRSVVTVLIGVVLLVAPHIIGAPQLDAFSGVAPPELSGEYVARSFAVSMAAWVTLGIAAGFFWNREPAAA